MAVKDPPYAVGALEYFSDACGTIYADDLGQAMQRTVEALSERGYSPVQARLTAARSVRFVGLAKHEDDGTEAV